MTGAWRLHLVLAASGIVFVLVPVVLVGFLAEGWRRDLALTAYSTLLAGVFAAASWLLDRSRRAQYTEMIVEARRPGSAALMPNPSRHRRFLRRRVPLVLGLCALAVVFPHLRTIAELLVPWIVSLAVVSTVVWHARVPGLIGTHDGVVTRRHGLIPWAEITAAPLVRSGDARFLQIWVRDRVELALRPLPARPRLIRSVIAFGQRRTAPLTGVYEPFVLNDLDAYQLELEALAGRSLRELPAC